MIQIFFQLCMGNMHDCIAALPVVKRRTNEPQQQQSSDSTDSEDTDNNGLCH